MGQQTALRYNIHASNKCDKCGMKNNGCCHDEYKFVKLTLDQQLTKTDGHGQAYSYSFLNYPVVSQIMPVAAARVHALDLYFSPPDKREARLFKFTCTYRI
jgi:hypothetical protein